MNRPPALAAFTCSVTPISLLSAGIYVCGVYVFSRTLAAPLTLIMIMLLDFEVRTCSRQCAATEKAIQPGEVYFSMLEIEATETIRRDYCAEAWQQPPEDSLGWWRSRVPLKNEMPQLAPVDVLLNLFAALLDKPADAQFRYLLGLLLIRRRVLKREDSFRNESGREVLALYSPRREERYELVVDPPNQEQAEQIQQRMIHLLYGDRDTHSLD